MKKILIIAVILLIGLNIGATAQTQFEDVEYDGEPLTEDNVFSSYETWKLLEQRPVLTFKYTAIGYKHSYQKLISLLEANNLEFKHPIRDGSYLTSYIDGYTDYSSVIMSCSSGSSEIILGWGDELNNINWMVSDELIMIIVFHTDQ